MESRNVKTGSKFLLKLVLQVFKAKIQHLNMPLAHQGKWKIKYWILTRDYSIPNHRGYTCSLWTLFHYLLANSDDASSSQAAGVIHSIVTDFFGCSDCVENFKKEIVTFPITAVNDNKSGVLWLWTLHNSGMLILEKPLHPVKKLS